MTTAEPDKNSAVRSESPNPAVVPVTTETGTTVITIPDDYRLSIDRDCLSFKKIYALRTEAERYNARFKQTGQERVWVHSFNAVRNLNTIAHIALLAVAIASVVTHSDYSVRCLKSVKRIA